jgi:hypothetical protein
VHVFVESAAIMASQVMSQHVLGHVPLEAAAPPPLLPAAVPPPPLPEQEQPVQSQPVSSSMAHVFVESAAMMASQVMSQHVLGHWLKHGAGWSSNINANTAADR